MKNEGYLLIDHQASPGLTVEDFAKIGITPQGLAKLGLDINEFGEGKRLERATRRCCHCGNQVFLSPERVRPRNYCRTCPKGHDYVCDRPACHFDCAPYRKKLDKIADDWAKADKMARENPAIPNFVTLNLPDENDPAPSIIKEL